MVNNRQWTRNQDKLFEQAIVLYPENTPDRWEKIAGEICGKSAAEIEEHYEDLVHDVTEIESGRIEVPRYEGAECDAFWSNTMSFRVAKEKEREAERRKGVPWTEEEHRLFLIGLEKYGKGDWRSISRNAVISRTPTQVASHAQKYFLRLSASSIKKDKKRSGIHDLTMAQPNQHNGSTYGPI